LDNIIDINGQRNAQLAIDQLNKEQEKHLKDANICRIHEFLIDMVTANPELAEKITAKKDVLKNAMNVLRETARKNQTGGCGGMSDKEGFELIMKDLGITGYEVVLAPVVRKVGTPEEPAAKHRKTYLDLDDFL
jgi:hypothetical protein